MADELKNGTENTEEVEEIEVVTLTDENGVETEFQILGTTEMNGITYYALYPLDENEEGSEFIVLRAEKDENGEEMTADLTQDETDPMKYTFTMPCSNVTVKAEFEEITDESESTLTATIFSEGNIWIIIASI